jgi:hypothetical protein
MNIPIEILSMVKCSTRSTEVLRNTHRILGERWTEAKIVAYAWLLISLESIKEKTHHR